MTAVASSMLAFLFLILFLSSPFSLAQPDNATLHALDTRGRYDKPTPNVLQNCGGYTITYGRNYLGDGNSGVVWDGIAERLVPGASKTKRQVIRVAIKKYAQSDHLIQSMEDIKKNNELIKEFYSGEDNLLNIIAICMVQERLYVISELMGGDMQQLMAEQNYYWKLMKKDEWWAQEAQIVAHYGDALKAVVALHDKDLGTANQLGVAHGDIKPENMFFKGTTFKVGICKLGDFDDISKDIEGIGTSYGTPVFKAPEATRQEYIKRRADDAWALCLMLVELIRNPHLTYPPPGFPYVKGDFDPHIDMTALMEHGWAITDPQKRAFYFQTILETPSWAGAEFISKCSGPEGERSTVRQMQTDFEPFKRRVGRVSLFSKLGPWLPHQGDFPPVGARLM